MSNRASHSLQPSPRFPGSQLVRKQPVMALRWASCFSHHPLLFIPTLLRKLQVRSTMAPTGSTADGQSAEEGRRRLPAQALRVTSKFLLPKRQAGSPAQTHAMKTPCLAEKPGRGLWNRILSGPCPHTGAPSSISNGHSSFCEPALSSQCSMEGQCWKRHPRARALH